jgi:hypothetical protein
MTYVWEFVVDAQLIKLQLLQNRVICPIGNFPRSTPIRDINVSFQLPYVHDYITKLCSQQAQVIQNHENAHVLIIEQGEVRQGKCKRLNLGSGQAYNRPSD